MAPKRASVAARLSDAIRPFLKQRVFCTFDRHGELDPDNVLDNKPFILAIEKERMGRPSHNLQAQRTRSRSSVPANPKPMEQ
jgi:hypothetical protein